MGTADGLDYVKNWRKGRRVRWGDGAEYDLNCDKEEDLVCSKIWEGECSFKERVTRDVIDPKTGKNVKDEDGKNKQKRVTVTQSRKNFCPGLNNGKLKVSRRFD
jgi:hypothetical protein